MVGEWWRWRVARNVLAAIHSGDFAKAERIATRYTRLRPRDPHGWLILHRVPLNRGRYQKAEEILQRGRQQVAGSPELSNALAFLLEHTGRWQEALIVLQEIAGQYPDSPYAVVARVRLAEEERNFEEVLGLIHKAGREWELTNEDQHYCLLQLSADLSSLPGQMEATIKLLEKLAASRWGSPLPHLALAVLLDVKQGDVEKANEYQAEALRRWPGSEQSFYRKLAETREEWLRAEWMGYE